MSPIRYDAPMNALVVTKGHPFQRDPFFAARLKAVAGAALLLVGACALWAPDTAEFRMERANRGAERYSAWFGDSDGRILYFGLSPFWELYWRSGGDATRDLVQPGDQLIGRFDLATETFLAPLRVREMQPEVRSTVWDVLVHSNGRVYFTTLYEEMGSVAADGSDVRRFDDLGVGFNELDEGPDGNVYVTRYQSRPVGRTASSYGAVTVLTPEGELVRETRLASRDATQTAPKSIAVDPRSGEVWINTDTFRSGTGVYHETLRISGQGELLSREVPRAELLFPAFDQEGRGWFAERTGRTLTVRVTDGEALVASASLGPLALWDFVQDIKFAKDGTAALATWTGRVHLLRIEGGSLRRRDARFHMPADCFPARSAGLLYTAILHESRVYATAFCGASILRQGVRRP
jgi:hypothetical protein